MNNKYVSKNNVVFVGSIIETANCGFAEVLTLVGYRGTVKFLNTGYVGEYRKDHLVDGKIKDQLAPLTFGVGYTDGVLCKVGGKHLNYYNAWLGVLERCYSDKLQKQYPSYRDATVCKEWHSLKNFKSWFESSDYKEGFAVDKDLKVKGNKHYSPENCTLLPQRLNTLLINKYHNRVNKTLPIGVTQKKGGDKYHARCHIGNKQPHSIGHYHTIKEAFLAYKEYKESYIKEIATAYYNKGIICKSVYELFLKFEVLEEYQSSY